MVFSQEDRTWFTKKYTGQFNSVLPLNPGTGKGTSRLYNKGVGDYRFKWPNLGGRTLIEAKGSVDATTYSTLHDNLRRMSKQLTQGTDTLKAQAKELQSVNRRYRKMFKDASYTRAVWDKIPSHFIEKV